MELLIVVCCYELQGLKWIEFWKKKLLIYSSSEIVAKMYCLLPSRLRKCEADEGTKSRTNEEDYYISESLEQAKVRSISPHSFRPRAR